MRRAIGIVALPEQQPVEKGRARFSTEQKVQAGFAVALACLSVIGIISYLSALRERKDAAWVGHTHQTIAALRSLLSTLADAESAQRGFLITGEENYLEPFREAATALDSEIAAARRLIADDAMQQRRLNALAPLMSERVQTLQTNADLRRSDGLEAAQKAVASDQGRELHDRARDLIGEMEQTERALLGEREARAQRSSATTRSVIVGGSAAAFAFVFGALLVIRRDFAGSRRAEAALREARDELEARVNERTAALELANETLRASEADFRASFNSAAVGTAQAHPVTGHYLRVNPKFCEITGYSEEELLRMTFHELTHPDDREQDGEAHRRMLRGEVLEVSREKRYARKDRKVVWVSISASIIRDEAGQPLRTLAMIQDITERRRAEEMLRIKQAHAESLLRLSRKLERAATFAEILKASREELERTLGFGVVWFYLLSDDRKFFRLIRADEGTQPRASVAEGDMLVIEGDRMLEEIAAGGEIVVVEDARTDPRTNKAIVEKFGSRTIVNVPVALAEGRRGAIGTGSFGDEGVRKLGAAEREFLSALASHVAAVLDRVTALYARKQAEEEIHLLNTALERRVELRTAELEAANKELEAFSYSVSHDLRAPLRAVDGFSQAVLEDYAAQMPPEGQRYLHTIRDGAIRMGRLIDDLLAFSRLSRIPLARQPVAMSRLVADVLDEMKSEREGRQIEVCVGELPDCEGDPALLKQVWVNLIANAFKYTRKRELAKVEIGCADGSDGAEYFVRDNGTGFDMRYAGKLFGVFQRLHRAEEYEGTGVGLAIVQRVIHRHGGRVRAEGEPDRGATFHFTVGGNRET